MGGHALLTGQQKKQRVSDMKHAVSLQVIKRVSSFDIV